MGSLSFLRTGALIKISVAAVTVITLQFMAVQNQFLKKQRLGRECAFTEMAKTRQKHSEQLTLNS